MPVPLCDAHQPLYPENSYTFMHMPYWNRLIILCTNIMGGSHARRWWTNGISITAHWNFAHRLIFFLFFSHCEASGIEQQQKSQTTTSPVGRRERTVSWWTATLRPGTTCLAPSRIPESARWTPSLSSDTPTQWDHHTYMMMLYDTLLIKNFIVHQNNSVKGSCFYFK